MNDLALTKKCAEKMGLHVAEGTGKTVWTHAQWPDPDDSLGIDLYDPLHDDAQCMAMVKKFPRECIDAMNCHQSFLGTDLNRAICECVAAL